MKSSTRIKPNIFLLIFLAGIVMIGCSNQTQPTKIPVTPNPTATFQPTFTQTPLPTFPPFPKATLSPLPRDIFDNFKDISGYCKLTTAFGELQPGETIEEDVLSDSMIGQIWFSLSWRGGDLDLTLLQPDGTTLDSALVETEPNNLGFSSEPDYQEYFIRGPKSGTWKARITGKPGSPTSSPYMLEVRVSDASIVTVNFDKDEYLPGDVMKVSASIEDSMSAAPLGPEYIYGVVMHVIVEDPELNQYSFELYDDGQHEDGQANDGVYANTFDNTLAPGNYKFYFQISGLNNRAKEPFSRECFLGKTINPIPTPTPTASDSMVCTGSIEASEPLIVRAENEGGNDNSEYGRFAFYPKAISTDAGILFSWNVGFDGVMPQPNVYMNLLDDNLDPVGDVSLLFERNLIGDSADLVKMDNGAVLTYCGRFKNEDRLVSAFLDSSGRFLSEQRQEPVDRFCPYNGVETVWTGSRLMSVWSDASSVPVFTNEVLLNVADKTGKNLFWGQLYPDSVGIPHLAVGHGLVLMAVPIRTGYDLATQNRGQTHLAVYRFDLDGNKIGDEILLDPVPFNNEGQTFLGGFGSSFVVPTPNGWMLLASSTISGYYVAQLNSDGTLASGPAIMDTDRDFHNGFEDVIPYGNGVVILGNGGVFFLSDDGIIRQEWHSTRDDPLSMGSLVEHNGRLFVTYATVGTGRPKTNEVRIRELQCVP